MEIDKVIITKTANYSTYNGIYRIEYNTEDSELKRVTVTIYEKSDITEPYIGQISYENDYINCSIQKKDSISMYFEDFEVILTSIKKDLNPEP